MGALLCLTAWHWPSSDIRIWHQELLSHSHPLGPRLIFDTVDIIVCGTLASMCCFMYAIGRIVLSVGCMYAIGRITGSIKPNTNESEFCTDYSVKLYVDDTLNCLRYVTVLSTCKYWS